MIIVDLSESTAVLGFDPSFWACALRFRQAVPSQGNHGQARRQIHEQKLENPTISVCFHGSEINLFSMQSVNEANVSLFS